MFDSAAEFARETNLHRSTIINLIKQGKIKAYKCTKNGEKRSPKQHYKIPESEKKKIKKINKPYDKLGKIWSDTEIYILLNSKGVKAKIIANMIGRTPNAVNIRRHILRRLGYEV